MGLLDNKLNIDEAQELFWINGVKRSKAWFRWMVQTRQMKSSKIFNARVMTRKELEKWLEKCKEKDDKPFPF